MLDARAAIVAAGPIANFILAIVIFAGLFTFYGKPNMSARVDKIEAGSAAAAAGFQVGDVVTAIDNQPIENFSDMQRIVSIRAGEKLSFTIKRGDSIVQLQRTRRSSRKIKDAFGNAHRLGVLGITRATQPGDVTDRAGQSGDRGVAGRQGNLVRDRPDSGLYRRGLHRTRGGRSGRRPAANRADFGAGRDVSVLAALIHLAAVLSISIGLLNLFPVPLLDGGHLLFYAVEAVRGRPLSDRAQEMGFRIGLGLVLMLMVFATYNDILHLAAS